MRSVRKLPDTTLRLTGLPQQGRTYNTHVPAARASLVACRIKRGSRKALPYYPFLGGGRVETSGPRRRNEVSGATQQDYRRRIAEGSRWQAKITKDHGCQPEWRGEARRRERRERWVLRSATCGAPPATGPARQAQGRREPVIKSLPKTTLTEHSSVLVRA